MTSKLALYFAAVIAVSCSGCSQTPPSPLPAGKAAYDAMSVGATQVDDSLIKDGDHLAVKVLGEEELTSEYIVDSRGVFQMPLIGDVAAAGLSTGELRTLITHRLSAHYLRDPQIAVSLVARPSATFTVEGSVTAAGRFEATPDMTLLGAMAMAKSPTLTAKLSEVVVFRTINGQRLGGRFNLREIRKGLAPDPQILPGDTVVVGSSAIKAAWRDFLQAAPVFNIFYLVK